MICTFESVPVVSLAKAVTNIERSIKSAKLRDNIFFIYKPPELDMKIHTPWFAIVWRHIVHWTHLKSIFTSVVFWLRLLF